jgi:hypothetical protein
MAKPGTRSIQPARMPGMSFNGARKGNASVTAKG